MTIVSKGGLEQPQSVVFGMEPSGAKLLWEHTVRDGGPTPAYQLPAYTKIIVDEAGMVATNDLHTLAQLADHNHWDVVLVGDGHQLSAVGRGGMFDHLVTTHPGDVQRLGTIQRFEAAWEREASLDLRRGRTEVLDTYEQHGRLKTAVSLDDAIGQATAAWLKADANGDRVLITAATNETVNAVNQRIQQARYEQLSIGLEPATIAEGGKGYVCDLIVTRHNNRDLQTDRGITIANRHTFEITDVHTNGSITVEGKTGRVQLPAEYVREYVQLAYATTAHGAQGRTVSNAITIVEPATDHAGLYVALTRGRQSNIAIVPVDTSKTQTPVDVLAGVLRRDWADTPAHAQAAEIRQRQNIDVPANSVLRDPATAVKQTATVQPAAPRQPSKVAVLEPEHLRRLLDEQKTLTAEIRMLPNRLADASRNVDRLTPQLAQLQATVNGHRTSIAKQQQQLDGRRSGGVLHRARHSKTIERLETSILHEQQQLSMVQPTLTKTTAAHQAHTEVLRELQHRQTVAPQRLGKISTQIDADREARLTNARNHGVPKAVADAIKLLGERPKEQGTERTTYDRAVGDALQQHAAYGKAPTIKPPEQTQQIVKGRSLGR